MADSQRAVLFLQFIYPSMHSFRASSMSMASMLC